MATAHPAGVGVVSARPVLLVLPELGRGGAERHAVLTATAVDRTVWEPHVLALRGGPLRAELDSAGVPVTVLDVPAGRDGARALPRTSARIGAEIDALAPALVTGFHVAVDVPLRAALRRRRVAHLTWKHTYGHVGHRGLRERALEAATGSTVTRYGAVCHTQVRYLTDVLAIPPHRIDVVQNAVAPGEEPAPPPDGPPVLLVPAALRADKGHASVLRAFRGVLASRPEARLQLAGEGPERAALERAVRDLGVAGSVEILGLRHDVPDLLHASTACVLASTAVECFPYALLEAMAAGRAVVSTNVGGVPEMVDDGVTGALVPPRDDEALTAAMLRAIEPTTALTWGLAGRERVVTRFGLERWGARVTELFTRTSARLVTDEHDGHDEGDA